MVYRRVHPNWINWATDPPEIASGAFQDTTPERAEELGYPGPGMSVHRAAVLAELGMVPRDLLAGHEEFGLVGIRVGDLRANEMGVDPRPEEADPTHAVVFPVEDGRVKRSRGMQKRTRDAAHWEIIPGEG